MIIKLINDSTIQQFNNLLIILFIYLFLLVYSTYSKEDVN